MTQKLIRLEVNETEAALLYYSLIEARQIKEKEFEKTGNGLILGDIEELKALISRVFQEINRDQNHKC
ncbi:MAG: hypothetical protein M0Q38_09080 [Bacteroidales bacterium]|nr:hypothetical protein [Bacteroidales bacterium]